MKMKMKIGLAVRISCQDDPERRALVSVCRVRISRLDVEKVCVRMLSSRKGIEKRNFLVHAQLTQSEMFIFAIKNNTKRQENIAKRFPLLVTELWSALYSVLVCTVYCT